MEHVHGVLLEHVYGILLEGEVPVQVRARRLREHEVVRGVVGAHPPVGPDHLRRVRPRCALVGAGRPL